MHELKLAIEAVLDLANARGDEPDDSIYMVLEHNSTMGEFEDAIIHLTAVYDALKDKL